MDHVYGEHEVGGTAVLYLADVAFAAIGFPASLPLFPLPSKTWAVMSLVPGLAGGAAALMTFAYLMTRRQKGMEQNRGNTGHGFTRMNAGRGNQRSAAIRVHPRRARGVRT